MRTLWLSAALLAGCASGQGSPLPEGWDREAMTPPPGRPSRPVLPSTPLTLEQAIALAWERNPDLRAAASRVAIADAHVVEAGSAF